LPPTSTFFLCFHVISHLADASASAWVGLRALRHAKDYLHRIPDGLSRPRPRASHDSPSSRARSKCVSSADPRISILTSRGRSSKKVVWPGTAKYAAGVEDARDEILRYARDPAACGAFEAVASITEVAWRASWCGFKDPRTVT
jgi:hypothetical protein